MTGSRLDALFQKRDFKEKRQLVRGGRYTDTGDKMEVVVEEIEAVAQSFTA